MLLSPRNEQRRRRSDIGDHSATQEPDAYVSGQLAQWVRRSSQTVPAWVLLNQAAHGTIDELRAAAISAESTVESVLARAVIGRVRSQSERTAIQLDILLPIEALTAAEITTPRRLVELVGRALYD